MNDLQKNILDTFKRGACKTWKFSMQNLLAKIITLIVIVIAVLSIADGGYSQVFVLVVGVVLITYIVGAFNQDVEKTTDDDIEDIEAESDDSNKN